MSCKIVYDKYGVVNHVEENGVRSLEFDIIKEAVGEKAIDIYNVYREGTNKSDKLNKGTINPNRVEVTESSNPNKVGKFLSEQVGLVKDVSKRNTGKKGKTLQEAIQHSITKGKSYYHVNSDVKYNNEYSSTEGYVEDFLVTKAEFRINNEGTKTLDNLQVLEIVKGQGLVNKLLDVVVKDFVKRGEDLNIPSEIYEENKSVLEPYVLQGVLRKSRGNYIIRNNSSIKEALLIAMNSTEPLPYEDRALLRNYILSLGVTSTSELKNVLKELMPDGVLSFDYGNLSKVFNRYEIDHMEKSVELQDELQRIVSSVNATEYEIPEYDSNYVSVVSTEDISGKQKVSNPFLEQDKVIRQVAGNPDFLNVIDPIYVERYYQDEAFRSYLDYASKELGVLKKFKINENGELNEYKGDTSYYLSSVVGENIKSHKENIERSYELEKEEASKLIEEIYVNNIVSLEDYNLKVNTEEQVAKALSILDKVLYGDIEEASREFENLFEIETETVVVKTTNTNSDIILETNINDVEILSKYDLLNIGNNTYRKVSQNETIYDLLADIVELEMYNPRELNNEELLDELASRADGLGFKSDNKEDLARYMVYNISENIGGVGTETKVEESTTNKQDIEEYYKTDFESDFNDYLISNNNKDFIIKEGGITFKNNDPISVQEALEKLDEQAREDLIEYSKGNKNIPNLTKYENRPQDMTENIDEALEVEGISLPIEEYNPVMENRIKAYNNPEYVKELDRPYVDINTSLGENIKAVKNNVEEFIKIEGEIYENVRTIGGYSIFKKGPEIDNKYYTENIPLVELTTPESEITSISQEATESTIDLKSSKEALEEVNNKYFEC